ncbi:MAG: hypothetical protein MMC33_008492 [Icmadophila ericetorum]|nr:hypothetical protein [Icmadophila ericetorum]
MSTKVDVQTSINNGEGLDWNADIKLQSGLAELRSPGIVVALTGTSGFLGRKLLQKLVQAPQVKTIHCIAVRNLDSLVNISSSSKIVAHAGDLSRPNLGLTSEAIRRVFCFTNVVIHNGAEVSFSKPYNNLRDANVGSTKEIVRLSLEHNHVTHIQFVSTSGLATVLSRDLYETPACSSPPDVPGGAQGYFLTKLACELYLENVSTTTGLLVTIYRPTVIVGPDAPRLDVMHSVLHYSEKISAVPQLTGIQGTLQFVEVDRVAEDIVLDVTRDSTTHRSKVQYRSQYDENVEIQELGTFVGKRSGISSVPAVSVSEWVQKAEAAGLATEVAKFLGAVHLRESTKGEKLMLRRLWKGPPP